jgi:hypothetical protein
MLRSLALLPVAPEGLGSFADKEPSPSAPRAADGRSNGARDLPTSCSRGLDGIHEVAHFDADVTQLDDPQLPLASRSNDQVIADAQQGAKALSLLI